MTPITFEAKIESQDIKFEDGGTAVIVEPEWVVNGGDEHIFVRLQSWDETISEDIMYDRKNRREDNAMLGHKSIQNLFGKKVRVTIEVIE